MQFTDLPIELHYEIYKKLSPKDVLNMSEVFYTAAIYMDEMNDIIMYPVVIYHIWDRSVNKLPLEENAIIGVYDTFKELVEKLLGDCFDNSYLKFIDENTGDDTVEYAEDFYYKLCNILKETRSYKAVIREIDEFDTWYTTQRVFYGYGAVDVLEFFGVENYA